MIYMSFVHIQIFNLIFFNFIHSPWFILGVGFHSFIWLPLTLHLIFSQSYFYKKLCFSQVHSCFFIYTPSGVVLFCPTVVTFPRCMKAHGVSENDEGSMINISREALPTHFYSHSK